MIHLIDNSQILEEVIKSNKLVIIDFFATWCTPCQLQSESLKNVEKDYSDKIAIFKVDVDENQEVAIRYGITAMPTLVFFKNGEEVERQVGYMEENEIINLINDFNKEEGTI